MAATPLWATPEEYKSRLGANLNDVPTEKALLAEIYNQQFYGGTTIVTNMKQITAVTAGQTYTNALLANATLFNVFYDGVRLSGTTNPAYTFDDTTGEITFLIDITDGIELAIDYTTNP